MRRLLVFPALILAAQTGAETVDSRAIPYVDAEFEIDGQMDESAWSQALVVSLDYETRPGENTPPPVATRVRLIDTGRALVVGFEAEDPDPASIRAYLRDRDSAYSDDFVGVVLDTFNDERRALEFFANAFGAQMDLIQDDVNGNEDDSWDAIWDSVGQITEHGFVVEMEIPYTAMQLPQVDGEQTWGIDLLRFYPRDQRHRLSNNAQDRNVSCYLCQLEKFRGFARAEPGADLEVTPTLTITHGESRAELDQPLESTDTDVEPGLDVSWGITPNVTLNATLNPDFSQVEADVAQLDVNTTFALFFPEKRPFFLEGADFFDTPLNILYTRNVTDPDVGLRTTGKIGRNAFGVFVAQDTVTNFLIPGRLGSDLATLNEDSVDGMFRYRRDIGENSALGVAATVRDGTGYRNVVAGVDGRFRFSDSDTFSFQYLDSDTEYPAEVVEDFDQKPELGGGALRLAYDHRERDWYSYLRWSDFDEDFRADLGFITRVNYDQAIIGGGYRWWGEEDDWWTRIQINGDWDETEDQDGQLLEREAEAYISVQGPMQSYLEVGGGTRDRFWDGVLFPETFYSFFGEFQPMSGVSLELFARFGDQIDFANTVLGELEQYNPEIRLNLGRHWQFDLSHTYQRLSQERGEIFTANQSDFRITYQFDLRQRLRLTLQWTGVERNPDNYVDEVDRRTRSLATQLIYSYKVNPRTVLFAGYSDSGFEDDSVDSLTTTNRTLFMKLGYAWEPSF